MSKRTSPSTERSLGAAYSRAVHQLLDHDRGGWPRPGKRSEFQLEKATAILRYWPHKQPSKRVPVLPSRTLLRALKETLPAAGSPKSYAQKEAIESQLLKPQPVFSGSRESLRSPERPPEAE